MTLDEMLARAAIARTMAAYTVAGDRLDAAGLAAAFAPDGIVETDSVAEADVFRYEGRAAIEGWILRWRDRPADAGRVHAASFVRHHLSTSAIELDGPGRARGRTYWTAYTDIGPDHGGVYVDEFVAIDDDWLIARRRIREDWRAPGSLFGGSVERSR